MADIIEMKRYPEGSVRCILSNYSKEDLGIVAGQLQIRDFAGKKRQELVECAASRILDREFAAEYWIGLFEDERIRYEQVMAGERLIFDLSEYDSCEYLIRGGYLYLRHSTQLIVPDELKELYRDVNTEEYRRERQRYHMLRDYIRAAVNLYGEIPAEHLAEIINSQNEDKTTKGELVRTFQRMMRRSEAVEYMNGMFRDHYGAQSAGAGKSGRSSGGLEQYYIPEQKVFLKYAEPGYTEEPPAYRTFRDFLITEIGVKELTAEMICDQLHLRVMEGADLEGLIEELDLYEIWFRNRKQLLKARELLAALLMHTRRAENGGFTDWELEQKEEENEEAKAASHPDNIVDFAKRRGDYE